MVAAIANDGGIICLLTQQEIFHFSEQTKVICSEFTVVKKLDTIICIWQKHKGRQGNVKGCNEKRERFCYKLFESCWHREVGGHLTRTGASYEVI